MTDPGPEPGQRLPYPHMRNDCVMCRERDADLHVLGDQYNRADTGYQTRLCQQCAGSWLVTHALYSRPRDISPAEPVTVEYVVLPPGMDSWPGLP